MRGVMLCAAAGLMGAGCATIVNDAHIPVQFVPQGCRSLECSATNKRGQWSFTAPGTAMIRRSDDALHLSCRTPDGRTVTHMVASEMEGEKLGASVLFLDLGITDASTASTARRWSSPAADRIEHRMRRRRRPPERVKE